MYKDSPSKVWRMEKVRYQLIGGKCKSCHIVSYPKSVFCKGCKSLNSSDTFELKPIGKIISFSMIYVAPTGFENFAPYPIALVKLIDGPLVLSQITDYDENKLKIGTKVEAVFRKVFTSNRSGIIQYGTKFRPLIK